MENRVAKLEEKVGQLENRQDKLEDVQRRHEIEFAETRVYVKETYKTMEEVKALLQSLEKSTTERIEQQGKYYREELRQVRESVGEVEKAQAAAAAAAAQPPAKDDSSGKILDFSWKVIAGVFALATAVLGILQVVNKTGGGTP